MPASPEDPDDEGAQKPSAINEAEEKDDDEISLDNVTEPRESDVICGRGGAALRHPGNQTYRRLVNLNKGLYITCLKTEKLKISRSIVAAIREQKGRFLERNANAGTWFDIGDKKAVEKTSQALREGQPKLRQKMVEMGSSAPHVIPGMSTQQQLNHHQQQAFAASGLTAGQFSQAQPPQIGQPTRTPSGHSMPPPPSRINSNTTVETNTDLLLQRLSINSNANDSLPVSVTSGHMSTNSNPNLGAAVNVHGNTVGSASQRASLKTRLRPSLMQRGLAAAQELGIQESNLSLMSGFSDFSAISGSGMSLMNNANQHHNLNIGHNPLMTASIGSNILSNASANNFAGSVGGNMTVGSASDFGMSSQLTMTASPGPQAPMAVDTAMRHFDRRRLFAKMKYTRPPSGRSNHANGSNTLSHNGIHQSGHSMTDGMPDIHPVESTFSLLSNMSTSVTDVKPAAQPHASNNNMGYSFGQQQLRSSFQAQQQTDAMTDATSAAKPPPAATATAAANSSNESERNNPNHAGTSTAPVNDMAREFRDFVSVSGSRRSLMSGLSRISDTSDVNSIFSDLSKKIGNVSTRSIAMSEISGIDEIFDGDDDGDDDGEFQIDLIPVPAPAPSSSSVASGGGMDFDL